MTSDESESARAPAWARRFAVAGPLVLAVFQLVGTYGASRGQSDRHAVDALAVVLVLAGPLSLLLARRYPRVVLVFIAALTWVYLARDYPIGPVFASLAIGVVWTVVSRHRVTAWLVVGGLYAAELAHYLVVSAGQPPWPQLAGGAAWALLLLVLGEVVRTRRERSQISRRARAETARRHANEERLRIARELHDVVAHHMSMINMQAGIALHLVEKRPEQAQTALAVIKDASAEALGELRSLVTVLRDEAEPAPRQPASMLSSIDDLIERSAFAGLTVRRVVLGTPREVPATVDLAAFRIIQEATTNVLRHANTDHARVTIDYRVGALSVLVEDDGIGAGHVEPGSGLRGMRERALALGGTLEADARPVGGFRVAADLPTGGPP